MPRKNTPAAVDAPANASTSTHLTHAEVETAAEREHNERRQLLVAEFGDGLPWQPEHYEAEIRAEMHRGCAAFLRAGRLLQVARGCTAHGEWGAMLGRLGIEPRQAQRMMEAARRVAALPNASTSTHLIEAAKTSGKLIELLSLPEDQFAELADTGETGGLSLGDIADMSVRDLRAALREARADMDAKDERATKRERDIERLQKQVKQLKRDADKATPEEVITALRDKCQQAAMQVRVDLSSTGDGVESLRNRLSDLLAAANETGQDCSEFAAALIGELLTEIRSVRDDFGLPIVNDQGE